MQSAPTSVGESTSVGDIPANAQSVARHLRAANKSPNTIKAYLDAVSRLDAFLEARGMPRSVGTIHLEHVDAFVQKILRQHRYLRVVVGQSGCGHHRGLRTERAGHVAKGEGSLHRWSTACCIRC